MLLFYNWTPVFIFLIYMYAKQAFFKPFKPLPGRLPRKKHPERFTLKFKVSWANSATTEILWKLRNEQVATEVIRRFDRFCQTLIRTNLSHPSAQYNIGNPQGPHSGQSYASCSGDNLPNWLSYQIFFGTVNRSKQKKDSYEQSISVVFVQSAKLNLDPAIISEDIEWELSLYGCIYQPPKKPVEKKETKMQGKVYQDDNSTTSISAELSDDESEPELSNDDRPSLKGRNIPARPSTPTPFLNGPG